MTDCKRHDIVCFGEVLWDILPGGCQPGGAPMNVAYHLGRLGHSPVLISRIGIDESGRDLEAACTGNGLNTAYLQADFENETGKVYALPGAGHEMHYNIKTPASWDFIAFEDDYHELVAAADYFVFGTLAVRNSVSRQTLDLLLEAATCPVLDINLRAPFYDRRTVEELIRASAILKLNLPELELITGWFSPYTTPQDRVLALLDRFRLQSVIVTMGAQGALLYDGSFYKHPGYRVRVADTLGSGDAFLAGLLSRMIRRAGPQEALSFAGALGAFVATQSGGCPSYEPEQLTCLQQHQEFF